MPDLVDRPHHRERFSRLPEFNDKEMSPKYSLTIGRSDTKDLAPPA